MVNHSLTQMLVGKAGTDYRSLARKIAQQEGVDPDLFEQLIKAESAFNPQSKSPVGAMGLAQLMPGTAKGLGVKDPWDPEQNLRGGARYLKQQLNRFGGDVRLSLAAYNAGPGAVSKYRGVPPYRETQNYVSKIMSGYNSARKQGASAVSTASSTPVVKSDDSFTDGRDMSPFGVPGPGVIDRMNQAVPPLQGEPVIAPGSSLMIDQESQGMGPDEMQALKDSIQDMQAQIEIRKQRLQSSADELKNAITSPRATPPIPSPDGGMDHKSTGAAALGSAILGMLGVKGKHVAALANGFMGGKAQQEQSRLASEQRDYAMAEQKRADDIASKQMQYESDASGVNADMRSLSDLRGDLDSQIRQQQNSQEALKRLLVGKYYDPRTTSEERNSILALMGDNGFRVPAGAAASAATDGSTVQDQEGKRALAEDKLDFTRSKWKEELGYKLKSMEAVESRARASLESAAKSRADIMYRYMTTREDKARREEQSKLDQANKEVEKELSKLKSASNNLDVDISGLRGVISSLKSRESKLANQKPTGNYSTDKDNREMLRKLRQDIMDRESSLAQMTVKRDSLLKLIKETQASRTTKSPP